MFMTLPAQRALAPDEPYFTPRDPPRPPDRVLVLETGLLRATDVYTGRRLWETKLEVGLVPVTEEERRLIHRWPNRPRSLSPATEMVAVEDAIFLSDGR